MSKINILKHVLIFFLLLAGNAAAASFQPDSPINEAVETAIKRILSCKEKNAPLPDIEELAPLLEYMTVASGGSENQHPAKRDEGSGIYWRGLIEKPFAATLRYLFNPGISPELVHPASVRRGEIFPDSGVLNLSKPLWELLPELGETPLVLRGEEYEEITPDDFSGSYYAYKMKNLVLFFKYLDTPMLLRVSWQNGESEKGRKGAFCGQYGDWNFVFTSDSGGTATGLGWLSTYMYGSAALMLYYPMDDRRTGYVMFKWLNAGWSGINVVNRSHILSGADRNFAGMREVIRADGGLSVEELEEITHDTAHYDRFTMLTMLAPYCQELDRLSRDDSVLRRSEFQKILSGGKYASSLNDDELRALYRIVVLKRKLGKAVLGG
ncbi:MAG: hypothetical protein FWF99_03070 [Desulfovibrionaceae bacterium]|nr:hypothetical protein [Desulfovibrionaceae bacterium]